MTLKYAKPELLSPAGTLKNMRYAFAYGADNHVTAYVCVTMNLITLT